MYQYGHYGAAMLAYAPVGTAVALAGYEAVAAVGGAVCVSLTTLPDVDHRVPLIDHRGPTHTLLFTFLVASALAGVTAVLADAAASAAGTGVVAFAFVVGVVSIGSHLLADAITPMGIRPFWPLSRRRYTLAVTTAANRAANYLLFGLGVLAAGGAVALVSI